MYHGCFFKRLQRKGNGCRIPKSTLKLSARFVRLLSNESGLIHDRIMRDLDARLLCTLAVAFCQPQGADSVYLKVSSLLYWNDQQCSLVFGTVTPSPYRVTLRYSDTHCGKGWFYFSLNLTTFPYCASLLFPRIHVLREK